MILLLGASRLASFSFELSLKSIATGTLTVKTEPSPLVLCNWMSPPSIFMFSLAIDKPRPTPSMPCAPGNRVKAWNTRSHSSSVIPTPVSATFTVSQPPPTTAASTTPLPSLVYFKALLTRLSIICFILNASATHILEPHLWVWHSKTRDFSIAWGRRSATQLSMSCDGRKLTFCGFILPFSNWW